MSLRLTIGQARDRLDDANGWAGALESTATISARPGGVEREWDTQEETRKRLIAARNLIDRALAEIGAAR